MAEIKVSYTIRNTDGTYKILHRRDAPDDADLPEDLSASSSSTIVAGSSVKKVVELDTPRKWQHCLARLAVYLISGWELFGTYLGMAIVSERFGRVLLVQREEDSDGCDPTASDDAFYKSFVLAVETKDPTTDNSLQPLSLFLQDSNNHLHLPWSLYDGGTDETGQPALNHSSTRIFVDFLAQGIDVLADQAPPEGQELSRVSVPRGPTIAELRNKTFNSTRDRDLAASLAHPEVPKPERPSSASATAESESRGPLPGGPVPSTRQPPAAPSKRTSQALSSRSNGPTTRPKRGTAQQTDQAVHRWLSTLPTVLDPPDVPAADSVSTEGRMDWKPGASRIVNAPIQPQPGLETSMSRRSASWNASTAPSAMPPQHSHDQDGSADSRAESGSSHTEEEGSEVSKADMPMTDKEVLAAVLQLPIAMVTVSSSTMDMMLQDVRSGQE